MRVRCDGGFNTTAKENNIYRRVSSQNTHLTLQVHTLVIMNQVQLTIFNSIHCNRDYNAAYKLIQYTLKPYKTHVQHF